MWYKNMQINIMHALSYIANKIKTMDARRRVSGKGRLDR